MKEFAKGGIVSGADGKIPCMINNDYIITPRQLELIPRDQLQLEVEMTIDQTGSQTPEQSK